MIHRIVHHNGHMQPIEQTRLSPGQAGLLSGWGLFTTLRVFHGVPFAYERHWRRLARDAARTRVPFAFDAERVRGQLMELVRANEVVEGTARIYAIYNQVGFWPSDEQAPQVDLLLCTAGLPPHHEPGRLDLREHGRHAASPLAGVKVTSWLNNVWNFAEAQARGFNEVVLLNERGEAAECTAANIFCVRRGTVETPPLSAGCLEGVTRGLLLELAPQAGVPMIERTLRPADLFSADEIFITSTNRSLLGIGEIAGHIYAAAPGPVTQKLEKMFVAHMNDYVAQHAVAR